METLPAQRTDRIWAVLCHASALLGFFVPAAGHFLGPLIVWLVKREESAAVNEHGKESLNFQISMLIYAALLGVVCFILMFVLVGFLLIPFFAILHIVNVVFVIIASVKANHGELYRYPFTIRVLK
ncbi:MAG: DUF4870 domain-containing protein [Chthoniobacterales bacterium]|nr:DUF4870 domain-containing protein [Chthoniobacterales bacterium]